MLPKYSGPGCLGYRHDYDLDVLRLREMAKQIAPKRDGVLLDRVKKTERE